MGSSRLDGGCVDDLKVRQCGVSSDLLAHEAERLQNVASGSGQ